jgi:hypothetical protein
MPLLIPNESIAYGADRRRTLVPINTVEEIRATVYAVQNPIQALLSALPVAFAPNDHYGSVAAAVSRSCADEVGEAVLEAVQLHS